MFIVPQGTTPDWKLEYVFDRAAGMRVAKRSAIEKDFFRSLFRCPMKVLLMPGQAAGPGSIFSKPLPCKFSPKKPTLRMAGPGGRPPGPEPEFRFLFGKGKNRVWEEVWNERLAKVSFGADSMKLKMRRLPPTVAPHYFYFHRRLNLSKQL